MWKLLNSLHRPNIRMIQADLSAARALFGASVSLRYQWTLIRLRQWRRQAVTELQRFVDAYRFRPQ